jgi:hypothetical protein
MLDSKLRTSSDQAVPRWFVAELGELYLQYPNAGQMPKTGAAARWRVIALNPDRATRNDVPDEAILTAIRRAPREASDTNWMPSCELVRRVATAEARTLADPKADLSRPALPEPEPTLPPDNPWCETLERLKRGEIPGRAVVREIVRGVAEHTAIGGTRSSRASGGCSEPQGTGMRRAS